MKKSLLMALIAVLFSASAFSQVTWNVKAGLTMNKYSDTKKLYDEGGKIKAGYTFGVGMDYAFTESWSLQPSLMFTTKGMKFSEEDTDEKSTDTFNPVYLQLPVLAAFKVRLAENTKLVITAGPYFALGLGGKMKSTYEYRGTEETEKYKLFSKEDGAREALMKRFDVGLNYGIGVEFDKFLVGFAGEYGFVNSFNDLEDCSPKNIGFSIQVGYKF